MYAADLDDWDLPDKHFEWISHSNHFHLDPSSGSLTMTANTPEGCYVMRVTARDLRRRETAECDVTVRVQSLSHQAVEESQLVTFGRVSDVEFIKVS